jgi:hypothetical protein
MTKKSTAKLEYDRKKEMINHIGVCIAKIVNDSLCHLLDLGQRFSEYEQDKAEEVCTEVNE